MSNWKMILTTTGFVLLFALCGLVAFVQAVFLASIGDYPKAVVIGVVACIAPCMVAHVISTTRQWLRDDREFDALIATVADDLARNDWQAADEHLDAARAFVSSRYPRAPVDGGGRRVEEGR